MVKQKEVEEEKKIMCNILSFPVLLNRCPGSMFCLERKWKIVLEGNPVKSLPTFGWLVSWFLSVLCMVASEE